MKGKRLLALLLAAMMALAVVPMPALGYDYEERLTLNEWTRFWIWAPPTSGSYCTCQSDRLPTGMAWSYEYNMSTGNYEYCIKGTPTKIGKYDVKFEFHPEEAQSSSVVIRFIVRPDPNEYFPFLQDYTCSGTVGEYFWYRFPTAFGGAAQDWEFGEYYNPGGQNDDIGKIGLNVLKEGVLCGTPTKAGTYEFWIYANMYFDGEWYDDYAKVTLTVKNAPTPAPTPKPTPKPTAAPTAAPTPVSASARKAPDCVFEATHDIKVDPGEEFEIVLISDFGSCTLGDVVITGAPFPDTVSFENIDGRYVVRGVMPEEAFAEGYYYDEDGEPSNLFLFFLNMSCDGLNYCVRYRVMEDTHEVELYPEAVPMTGFGE